MQKAIQLAQKIAKHPDNNWAQELQAINLHSIFSPIYEQEKISFEGMNIIVAFIIYSYDNDSPWINIKQDRYENKMRILKGLSADHSDPVFISIAMNENDIVNDVIVEYLMEQVDWRWQTVYSLLDYHAKMIRIGNRNTEEKRTWQALNKDGNAVQLHEEYDASAITKINKEKGELLTKAIEARQKADILLAEMRKDMMATDHAVQQDFGFSITDEKKIDIMSWKQFIERKNERLKQASLQ